MRTVLVTGAGGFIGRHVLPRLAGGGWRVHAVGRRPPTPEDGVIWHAADLLAAGSAAAVLERVRPSHLLHLAWYAEPGKYWRSPENHRWVHASLELAEAFRAAGGRRLVTAGTCAEYDWRYGVCREDLTPLAPSTPYGVCKNALRQVLESWGEVHGVAVAWGRVFHLYGPHEPPGRLVPAVITALLRGEEARCSHGGQVRDFLHVDDVAAAFARLLDGDGTGAFNIGSAEPVRLREVIDAVADQLAARDRVRLGALAAPADDPPVLVADNRRLRALGWRPEIELSRGIADAIDWWRREVPELSERESV
ncbi:NAD(P)-dependent oxidoreductase [Azospirillum sp.]|uniref:NAD-dependent epimerase/dehydratase family protein n=1 Tax=Azospirillum sp. TaxID=34012 RepID=UPI002D594C3E|nr:NAD(P)-dependent oxidoreductase [Azospirillum sp.]HYD69451.1 NAD(P)-dependent oxidoreductase [Azospirillum sp.]